VSAAGQIDAVNVEDDQRTALERWGLGPCLVTSTARSSLEALHDLVDDVLCQVAGLSAVDDVDIGDVRLVLEPLLDHPDAVESGEVSIAPPLRLAGRSPPKQIGMSFWRLLHDQPLDHDG
jgi:hypothetical protein